MAKRLLVILSVLMLLLIVAAAKAAPPSKALIDSLIAVESGGDDNAVGDKHLAKKAYGCLQVRQPCVDDYNAAHGTAHKAEDCLGNRALSVRICGWYVDRYATAKRLGHTPTDEDKVRIWNGGPNGWKRKSTQEYWRKVKDQLGR